MAWFEVDIYKKCIEVDLHNYTHSTAIATSLEKIKEAYEHGFKSIKIIHGAQDVRNKKDGGSIKFALRALLNSGELDRWVERRSNNNRFDGGSMLIALRPNPEPVDRDWKEMPPYEYG
jgi:hypothetical protein